MDDLLCEHLSYFYKNNFYCASFFFANTYPLAYHFAQNIRESKEITERIKILGWDKVRDIPYEFFKKPFLFYLTPYQFKKFYDNRKKFDGNIYNFEEPITKYRPRYIFLSRNKFISNVLKIKFDKYLSVDDLRNIFIESEIVEFFSDTPKQADEISKIVINPILKDSNVRIKLFKRFNSKNQFNVRLNDVKRNISIHFSGAPYTKLMKDMRKYFIPIQLPDEYFQKTDVFDLSICFYLPSSKTDPKLVKDSHELLKAYHDQLFLHARDKSKYIYFSKILDGYRRISRNIFPLDIFSDVQEYCQCIENHHS